MTTERRTSVLWLFTLLLPAAGCPAQHARVAPASTAPMEEPAPAPAPAPTLSDEQILENCKDRELVLRPKERVQCAAAAERMRLKQAHAAPPPTVTPPPPVTETKPATPPSTPGSDPAADEAAARVLYDDGLKLMDEKAYAKACPKLEESHRLKANVNVQFFLADCYEQLGKTASAWLNFSGAAAAAKASGQSSKAEQAKKRAAALEPKLTRVSIKVADEVPGLEIRRGNTVVTKPQWDSAIPVDPGDIEIAARAPNKKPFMIRVKATTPGTVVIVVPRLDDVAK